MSADDRELAIGPNTRNDEYLGDAATEKISKGDLHTEHVAYNDSNPSKQRVVIILLGLGVSPLITSLNRDQPG